VKGIYLDRPLLKLLWRASVASRMALYQQWAWKQSGGAGQLAARLQEAADGARAAANVIEALVGVFGAYLAPGASKRRAKA
jgi:hypothetical protein